MRENQILTLSQHAFFGFGVVFKVSRGEPNFYALTYVLNCIGKNDFGVIGSLVLSEKKSAFNVYIPLTCSRAASSHTSSLFGQCSQPALISFLAATILPACSSKQAAAIHPGECFGFDLTRESKSIRALLMSPISASDLIATLSRDVRYPLGSTDVAVPEVTPDT